MNSVHNSSILDRKQLVLCRVVLIYLLNPHSLIEHEFVLLGVLPHNPLIILVLQVNIHPHPLSSEVIVVVVAAAAAAVIVGAVGDDYQQYSNDQIHLLKFYSREFLVVQDMN